MAESEEEKPRAFKVQDRRRFSPEGEPKPDTEEREEQAAKPESETVSAASSSERERGGGRRADETAVEITFAGFLMGLSTEALVHLGEIPEPASGQPRRDLPAAQQLIDLLGVLQEKTRGNLDADEAKLLDSILYDLRIRYVEIARPGPS